MVNLVKTISTSFDNFKRRLVKVLRFGKSDIQTPFQVSPFGIDSNPLQDMIAVYSETGEQGKNVIIGYLNREMLASPGETRLYADGGAYVWLKGSVIELNGNNDNVVRFSPLDSELTSTVNALNQELIKIQAAITQLGGAYERRQIFINIDQAKIEEVKTS